MEHVHGVQCLSKNEKEVLETKVKALYTNILYVFDEKRKQLKDMEEKRNEIKKWLVQFEEMLLDVEMVERFDTLAEYEEYLKVSNAECFMFQLLNHYIL